MLFQLRFHFRNRFLFPPGYGSATSIRILPKCESKHYEQRWDFKCNGNPIKYNWRNSYKNILTITQLFNQWTTGNCNRLIKPCVLCVVPRAVSQVLMQGVLAIKEPNKSLALGCCCKCTVYYPLYVHWYTILYVAMQ